MTGPRCAEFADRLRAGEPMIGTWIKTPSPVVCEVLSASPLDVLALDAEHAPFGRAEIDACLALTRLADMPALVRVPSADPAHLLNALDCGATGVIVPHVTSAAAAKAVARASHFGAGGRGYAGSSRAAGFATRPMADHLAASARQTAVIAMIEDPEAVEDIDAICAVDGIDCLFIGRIDLTVALGASSPADPAVIQAVERVCEAGRKAGRTVGMFVSRPDEASQWRERGASLFLLSSDHGFLADGAAALADGFHASSR